MLWLEVTLPTDYETTLNLKATIRLNNSASELVSDYQVRGEKALREPVIDEDDGWE